MSPTKFRSAPSSPERWARAPIPKIGRKAAEEDTNRLIEMLQGADMVFVTAGLGGGTGAGAASVVASLAKELDALTVAVVTKPFTFEGPKRMRLAEQSMEELAEVVDTLITIPNDRLLAIVPRGTSIKQAFRVADDILRQAVQGISDIIRTPGVINLDFSDIKATMLGMGHAIMGTATARGENAAVEAARQAISCPLLEDTKIAGSKRILINITCAGTLGLHEVDEACSIVREAAESDDLQITFGITNDDSLGDAVKITVIATGFRMPTPLLDAQRESRPFMDQIPDPCRPSPRPPNRLRVVEVVQAEEPPVYAAGAGSRRSRYARIRTSRQAFELIFTHGAGRCSAASSACFLLCPRCTRAFFSLI